MSWLPFEFAGAQDEGGASLVRNPTSPVHSMKRSTIPHLPPANVLHDDGLDELHANERQDGGLAVLLLLRGLALFHIVPYSAPAHPHQHQHHRDHAPHTHSHLAIQGRTPLGPALPLSLAHESASGKRNGVSASLSAVTAAMATACVKEDEEERDVFLLLPLSLRVYSCSFVCSVLLCRRLLTERSGPALQFPSPTTLASMTSLVTPISTDSLHQPHISTIHHAVTQSAKKCSKISPMPFAHISAPLRTAATHQRPNT
ncbi:hypothetical protein M427DRAFT_30051 [Gonapodya prolifera JEL478]|uniref:Uncharacterized protein n=1 Tax=Gonapodya prolifera (strain JEL478) TaxID=1344416 RepID=A0A139AMC5_GONPJ|nr:hypothetical protein M427DRAFT_30051 [Gonapodya prolifera JEL478]|eukprot:KXS17927.1 hypothetical protein M427DRAFT_30051 [Gonapodya prolifera JEL478]